ncbi:MAG: Fic family protein [Wenzhouxiangellaceae bacterium]
MSSMSFGRPVRNRTAFSFVPFHIDKILASPVVDLLATQARSVNLNRITSSINVEIWNFVFYYSVLTSVWRYFPTVTPAAIARDARRHTIYVQQLEISLEMQAVALQLQQKTLRRANLSALKTLFDKSSCGQDSAHLERREEPASFTGINGRTYFCSQPSVGMKWIEQITKTKLSEDPYKRLAESWLLALSLLAVHPFSNGNGRLSRILFNALCNTGTHYPVPLSVFFLLRNGKSLYNVLIKRILDGERVALGAHFESCVNHCVAFCRAAQRIQTEGKRDRTYFQRISIGDWLDQARNQLTKIYNDNDRNELARLTRLEPFVYGGI